MIEERLDRFNEARSVRQVSMAFKRGQVLPARINVELVRVSNGPESAIVEAAWLQAGGRLYFEHCLMHVALLAGAGVKSGEHKCLHGHFRESDHRHASGTSSLVSNFCIGSSLSERFDA